MTWAKCKLHSSPGSRPQCCSLPLIFTEMALYVNSLGSEVQAGIQHRAGLLHTLRSLMSRSSRIA